MAQFSGSTYSAAVDESKRLIALATFGNTQVDMSDYYSKTDSDNKFAAKVDLDTLTTSFDDLKTVHDTHVADSVAHLTQDERDKILTTDDITTSISTNPSNDKVASEKAVNDLLQTEGSGNLTIHLNEDLNNLIYNRTRVWMNSQTDQIGTFTNMPSVKYTECAVIFIPYENATDEFGEQIFVGNTNEIFIRNKFHTEWTSWKRVCTTSVADVPKTVITSENTNITLNQSCVYEVIDGICYVTLWGFRSTVTGQHIICTSMPKTKITSQGMGTYGTSGVSGCCAFIYSDNKRNSKLFVEISVTDTDLFCSFSYPVAEN